MNNNSPSTSNDEEEKLPEKETQQQHTPQQKPPEQNYDPCTQHQQEIEEWKKKAGEYLAGWQRAQADYQNLQKESERRMSETIKYATEGFLLELLPIVDHFKYAFKGVPETEKKSSWLVGIEHIQKNLMKILEEHGVSVVKTVGETFNPEVHEAIEEVEVQDGKSGTIIEEVATGFTLNGKVIQYAKVKVIK